MKYLLVACLLLVVLLLIYLRIKPYLNLARRVLGILNNARQAPQGEFTRRTDRASVRGEKLVRCRTCQVLLPASRAIALQRSDAIYCSPECAKAVGSRQ